VAGTFPDRSFSGNLTGIGKGENFGELGIFSAGSLNIGDTSVSIGRGGYRASIGDRPIRASTTSGASDSRAGAVGLWDNIVILSSHELGGGILDVLAYT
jgi:hypothetical protein